MVGQELLVLLPSSPSLLGRDTLLLLDSLLPAVAEISPRMIHLGRDSLDGISLLGRCYYFPVVFFLICHPSDIPLSRLARHSA